MNSVNRAFMVAFVLFTLATSGSAHAWEEWEKRLIAKNCLHYTERNIDNVFLRCFRVDLVNIHPGIVSFVRSTPTSLVGCASNGKHKWCEVLLINQKNREALTVSLDNQYSNSIELNALSLGDECYCNVTEWGIETDKSLFYNMGYVSGKEAYPIIRSLRNDESLAVYATIPHKYKSKYRAVFSKNNLQQFQLDIAASIDFVYGDK